MIKRAYFVAGIFNERVILMTSRYFNTQEEADHYITGVDKAWKPFVLQGDCEISFATPYELLGKRIREL